MDHGGVEELVIAGQSQHKLRNWRNDFGIAFLAPDKGDESLEALSVVFEGKCQLGLDEGVMEIATLLPLH